MNMSTKLRALLLIGMVTLGLIEWETGSRSRESTVWPRV